ncbi:MAG: FISUMP domain-containing protein, partial [Hallerella sp.]|nr:FISUMP domain-containing protein [Hallerella sp.]
CKKYGRLYSWKAALYACPVGWHLPGNIDFKTLYESVGGKQVAGKKLKNKEGWNNNGNGTDAFGFSALPAGYRYSNGYYDDEGDDALFWSSTESTSGYAYDMYLYYYSDGASLYYDDKYYGFSVRCVKD